MCRAAPVPQGQSNCVNGCQGAGRCVDGFCFCPEGRFGIDCSRTQVGTSRRGPRHAACSGMNVWVSSLAALRMLSSGNAVFWQAFERQEPRPDATQLRIYIYELPHSLARAEALDHHIQVSGQLRWHRGVESVTIRSGLLEFYLCDCRIKSYGQGLCKECSFCSRKSRTMPAHAHNTTQICGTVLV